MTKPYKLKLTKLAFLSSVDMPAQGEGAKALLLKSGDAFSITARVIKQSDELGLVFGHAFASSLDGGQTGHVDSQSDVIDPDFLKTAMEFMEAGGPTDVNHDFESDGRIVFAWPLMPEVNDALGIKSDVVGLAVAVKPSPETYARFKSGELTGFSIAGIGERSPILDEKRASVAPVIVAPPSKSTRTAPVPHVHKMETKIVVLTDAQHAHYAKLASAEADAFLSKSFVERDSVLADIAKSDPVVFKGELTGFEVRKSQGDFALKMAEAAEKAEKRAADAAARETIEKAAKETEVLKAKVKAEIPHLAGSDSVKESLYKAADAIGPEAVAMLKAADDAAKGRTVAKGVNPGSDPQPEGPQAELDALIAAEMTAKSVDKAKATVAVTNTAKGAALYAEVQKAKKAAR